MTASRHHYFRVYQSQIYPDKVKVSISVDASKSAAHNDILQSARIREINLLALLDLQETSIMQALLDICVEAYQEQGLKSTSKCA
jgi:hypothetical protein